MSKQLVRIRLKAYDHRILDNACTKIVETVKRAGGEISGPVPLPTEIEKFTILRAVHKYKDSREPICLVIFTQPSQSSSSRPSSIEMIGYLSTSASQ